MADVESFDPEDGYTEFAWVVDGYVIPWREGDEPRPVLAKYKPQLVTRHVCAWVPSNDPRFVPLDDPKPPPV